MVRILNNTCTKIKVKIYLYTDKEYKELLELLQKVTVIEVRFKGLMII